MKAKMCINCGAPLHSNVCEYCGTEYELDENNNNKNSGKQINDYVFELEINGEKSSFYLDELTVEDVFLDAYRDAEGLLHRQMGKRKRKLSLIEM